jgi:hypothetical protein
MADYLATGLVLQRRQVDLLEQIVAGGSRTGVLVQPPALSTIVPSVTTVSGGLTIVIEEGALKTTVITPTTDPAGFAAVFGQSTLDRFIALIEQRMAANEIQRRRLSGNAGVT